MTDVFSTQYRTDLAGALRASDIGRTVRLVLRTRDQDVDPSQRLSHG